MSDSGEAVTSQARLRPGRAAALLGRSGYRVIVPLILLLISVPCAHAFEVERSSSYYRDKHYQFELVALLDAPADRVQAVLRDYEHYPQLDTRILEARVLERPENYVVLLETIVRACFGPFCRNVKRVERVEESPLELAAITDASRSDVQFGETRTMLSVSEGRTRVSYRTSVEPAFWIPRFVGRRWMLSTLEDATTNLFMSVEMKAKEEHKDEHKEEHKEEHEGQGVAPEEKSEAGPESGPGEPGSEAQDPGPGARPQD